MTKTVLFGLLVLPHLTSPYKGEEKRQEGSRSC